MYVCGDDVKVSKVAFAYRTVAGSVSAMLPQDRLPEVWALVTHPLAEVAARGEDLASLLPPGCLPTAAKSAVRLHLVPMTLRLMEKRRQWLREALHEIDLDNRPHRVGMRLF